MTIPWVRRRRIERAKEIVVVRGHDHSRLEPAHDPFDIARRETAARNAAQEHVDVAVAQLVLDKVRRALVIEAHSGDLDPDAPHLAAAIRLRRQVIEVLARELAGIRHTEAELELAMPARHEVKAKRADLVIAEWLDRIEAVIERYPWPTLLLALGLGYVIARRMR